MTESSPPSDATGLVQEPWYHAVDAREAEYVRAANAALAELPDRGCRWWNYTVSHATFDMVVGEPYGPLNLCICLAACRSISGPIEWPAQELRVTWHNDREADKAWEFVVEDESVGFKAVAGMFLWKRGYDLMKYGSIWLPRVPLSELESPTPDPPTA